ncbi:MAG: hypothetical protein AAGF73_10700 [Actinomycetota bacterium]
MASSWPWPEPGEVPAALAVAVGATYLCVPETDVLAPVGWMVAGLFILERALSWRHLLVHVAAVGAVLSTGLVGATGRDSAEVGALFAFWPLVLLIATQALPRPPDAGLRLLILMVGGAATAVVSRTGALEPTIDPALVAAGVAGGVSAIGVALLLVILAPRLASSESDHDST